MECREFVKFDLEEALAELEASRSESTRVLLKVERFLRVICVFHWQGPVFFKKWLMQSRELIEFDLEAVQADLEPAVQRIGKENIPILT